MRPVTRLCVVVAAAWSPWVASAHAMLTVPPGRQFVHDVAIDPKTQGSDGYSTVIESPAWTDKASLNSGIGGGAGGKVTAAARGHGLCGDDGGRAMFSALGSAYGAAAPTVTWVEGATVRRARKGAARRGDPGSSRA